MHNRAVLAIDFGSAYTKIGLRTAWNTDSVLLRDMPLAPRDATFCIPSVVARVESQRRREWLIGVAGANQLPGEGVKLYQNWKTGLFADKPAGGGDASATAADSGKGEYVEVAVQFFRVLREDLQRMRFEHDVTALPVRICIPKLADGDASSRVILAILEEAGWRPAEGRSTLYEPESNALGILSRGRNATWIPPVRDFKPAPERSVNLPRMLEPRLAQAFRAVLNPKMRDYYGVLVTDIGAFTTDFGYVRFDSSFRTDDWNIPVITQQSYELGVRELDRAVVQRLSPLAQEAIERTRPGDWETLKNSVYRGEVVALRNPKGGVLRIGEGIEALKIRNAITAFADEVWRARRRFLSANQCGSIDAETLTGGGAMIPLVRELLTQRMRAESASWIHDLLDEEEPRSAIPSRDGHVDERAVEARARQNRELVRGGSAIGACSVFFE